MLRAPAPIDAVNASHIAKPKARRGPFGSLKSRTSTASGPSATSTQLPPLASL
jgi:hypothetical protein